MKENLTKELEELIEKCSETGDGYISLENLIYQIFKRYIEEDRGDEVALISYLKSLDQKVLRNILGIAKIMKDNNKSESGFAGIMSKDMEKVFQLSASLCGGSKLNAFTIIYAAMRLEDCDIIRELRIAGLNLGDSIKDPDSFFNGMLKEKRIEPKLDDFKEFEAAGQHEEVSGKALDINSTTPALDQFSFDMTKADGLGKYDPVVGREEEIDQIVKILCCRTKNNAVLLGDAGVGKTAVIESLVHRINEGTVPDRLKNKRVCSLDLNALVSGTKYRGEYEARLQKIIKEVTEHPEVIIYIDEFHNLVGNGSTSGGNGDAANILKPYLARGEFQCIGSTTAAEYRKFIEKDAALKRRFQNVPINEPGESETLSILKKVSKKYEEFHKVTYGQEVLKACVEWSGRYITDRFFPDKAIDCIDRAGTAASLRGDQDRSTLDTLNSEIEDLISKKIKAVEAQDFEEAAKIRAEELNKRESLEKEKKLLDKAASNRKNWSPVTLDDVAQEIAKISKVPIDKIRSTERTKIRDMKKVLESKVIGQEEAVTKIMTALQKNIMGFRDTTKPIASFLLCGETGTGKSYISKIVSQEFFGSQDSLIRIDCGELSDGKSSISKLTGTTPGYVGYDDEPVLEQIRRKPFSVLLVDEVDKVAPEAFNLFMNILDEGYCTLGNGERVDFRNTIIIFTGNIGTKELQQNGRGLGFITDQRKEEESIVMGSIKRFFRPEFLNRLTGIVVFNSLTKSDLKKIFVMEFDKVKKRVSDQGYQIKVTPDLRDKVVDSCDTKFGARDLHRKIEEYITEELSSAIINAPDEDLQGLKDISLDWLDGKVHVTFNHKV